MYPEAPGQEFAIEALYRHAGAQFYPVVVEALCGVLARAAVAAVAA